MELAYFLTSVIFVTLALYLLVYGLYMLRVRLSKNAAVETIGKELFQSSSDNLDYETARDEMRANSYSLVAIYRTSVAAKTRTWVKAETETS